MATSLATSLVWLKVLEKKEKKVIGLSSKPSKPATWEKHVHCSHPVGPKFGCPIWPPKAQILAAFDAFGSVFLLFQAEIPLQRFIH